MENLSHEWLQDFMCIIYFSIYILIAAHEVSNRSPLRLFMWIILNHRIKYTWQLLSLIQVFCLTQCWLEIKNTSIHNKACKRSNFLHMGPEFWEENNDWSATSRTSPVKWMLPPSIKKTHMKKKCFFSGWTTKSGYSPTP